MHGYRLKHHPEHHPTMGDNNIRRFNRATRVKTFGQDNAADFDSASRANAPTLI